MKRSLNNKYFETIAVDISKKALEICEINQKRIFSEVTFLNQPYIMDNDKDVKNYTNIVSRLWNRDGIVYGDCIETGLVINKTPLLITKRIFKYNVCKIAKIYLENENQIK